MILFLEVALFLKSLGYEKMIDFCRGKCPNKGNSRNIRNSLGVKNSSGVINSNPASFVWCIASQEIDDQFPTTTTKEWNKPLFRLLQKFHFSLLFTRASRLWEMIFLLSREPYYFFLYFIFITVHIVLESSILSWHQTVLIWNRWSKSTNGFL